MRRTLLALAVYGPMLAYLAAFASGCYGPLAEHPCDTAIDVAECWASREPGELP